MSVDLSAFLQGRTPLTWPTIVAKAAWTPELPSWRGKGGKGDALPPGSKGLGTAGND